VQNCTDNNKKGTLFVARDHIAKAHKCRRIEAIRRVLADAQGADWCGSKASRDALEVAKKVLADSQITPAEVLSSSELRPVATAGGGGAAAGNAGIGVGGFVRPMGDNPIQALQNMLRLVHDVFFQPREAVRQREQRDYNGLAGQCRRFADGLLFLVIGGAAGGLHVMFALPVISSILRSIVSVVIGRGYISAFIGALGTAAITWGVAVTPFNRPLVIGTSIIFGFFGISDFLGLSSSASYSGWMSCLWIMVLTLCYSFVIEGAIIQRMSERSFGFRYVGTVLAMLLVSQIVVRWRAMIWTTSALMIHIVSTYVDFVLPPLEGIEQMNTLYVYGLYGAAAVTRFFAMLFRS
jgi:hypothetical protein